MATIGITGGSGFVGQHLTNLLTEKGYDVIIFTTRVSTKPPRKNVSYANWNPKKGSFDINGLKEVETIVHLAGAGIADKRWTAARKQEIVDSRVKATGFLVEQLKKYCTSCKTFIAASATGYYGPDRGNKPFTETDAPYHDFLAETCKEWEQSSAGAADFLRTVILRFGIVLGKEHGAFHEYFQPMKFGIMPILGSGKQVVSWIEVDDLARLIVYAIEHTAMTGTYNAVTPNPVTQKELMKTAARVKGGIAIPAPVPAFALKIMLGQMSTEVLKSCTVNSDKTLATGFTFNYPDVTSAIRAILK